MISFLLHRYNNEATLTSGLTRITLCVQSRVYLRNKSVFFVCLRTTYGQPFKSRGVFTFCRCVCFSFVCGRRRHLAIFRFAPRLRPGDEGKLVGRGGGDRRSDAGTTAEPGARTAAPPSDVWDGVPRGSKGHIDPVGPFVRGVRISRPLSGTHSGNPPLPGKKSAASPPAARPIHIPPRAERIPAIVDFTGGRSISQRYIPYFSRVSISRDTASRCWFTVGPPPWMVI